jgi:hypothetical protein
MKAMGEMRGCGESTKMHLNLRWRVLGFLRYHRDPLEK